jgi:hypothetical protein
LSWSSVAVAVKVTSAPDGNAEPSSGSMIVTIGAGGAGGRGRALCVRFHRC